MISELAFVEPMPGLGNGTRFDLVPVEGAAGLYTLQSSAETSTRILVLDAALHLPDYAPEIDDGQAASLGLESPDDAIVLVVVTAGESAISVNLMAPVVVNRLTGAGAQLILADTSLPLRFDLVSRRRSA